MGKQKNHGFTIIEVTLVLAISSLLLILMMSGITLAVQRQRFSDSVNGSQSFLQQQFDETQNTVNDRTTGVCGDPMNPGDPAIADPSTRGASNCVVLGKLIDIHAASGTNESTISSYDVLAQNVDPNVPPYDTMPDLDLIGSIKPTVITQATSAITYTVPWGAQIHDIEDGTTILGGTAVHDIALLRSPRSGIIHVYEIDQNKILSIPSNNITVLAPTLPTSSIKEISTSVKMCVTSVDLVSDTALLEIIPTGSQDGIITHFDDGAKGAYGCP